MQTQMNLKKIVVCLVALLLFSVLLSACPTAYPPPSGGGAAAPAQSSSAAAPAQSCQPLGQGKKVPVPNSNTADSIKVFADTCGNYEGNGPWNNASNLAIWPVDLSTLPPCPFNNCLAAVDVDPDNVKIVGGTKPLLTYDLETHKPKINPETCRNSYCYAIFQLMPGKWCDGRPSTANIWCNVGPAIPHSASTGWYADGKIKHLSIFALVELPEPIAVTQGELLRMFIASEFIDDGSGGLSVAVIFDETAGQFDPQGEQHILRFNHVDPSNKDKVTEECRDAGGIDGMFSCSFPYSVAVEFIYQDHEATMSNLDTGAEVRFYTEYAELH